jgi:hypothetical protein
MDRQDKPVVVSHFTCLYVALHLVHNTHSSYVLLSHIPLPPSHRYQPSRGALRRLKFTTLLHAAVWDIATCAAPQRNCGP